MLIWARESIALSFEGAALKASANVSKLETWESGLAAPTMAQLRTLARIYRRPSAIFYLKDPPQGWDAMRDFRPCMAKLVRLGRQNFMPSSGEPTIRESRL